MYPRACMHARTNGSRRAGGPLAAATGGVGGLPADADGARGGAAQCDLHAPVGGGWGCAQAVAAARYVELHNVVMGSDGAGRGGGWESSCVGGTAC